MTWIHGRQTPDNNLMRFVAQRFPSAAMMLDIGSGEGANARELLWRGHGVLTVDRSQYTNADLHADIREISLTPGTFNLIYDINTLCHVDHPPFETIKSWLKRDGVFFSIWPTLDTSDRVRDGKDYTHLVSEHDLRHMLNMFSGVKIGTAHYHLPGEDYFDSWIVEARP
jgi:SAM-dependent methyltransferase